MMATVVSLKNKKTAAVRVARVFKHARYQKTIRRHKNYLVGFSPSIKEGSLRLGQLVEIVPSSPRSARKRFWIIKIYD